MKVRPLELPDVLLFEPDVYGDERGFFVETWNHARYREAGLNERFVQANASRSAYGVLRGLHFQNPSPQGKLVYVLDGEVFDVAVDIRRGSPSFGHWVSATLDSQHMHQLYIPPGFAHGFCVTSNSALFCYLCTEFYAADADCGIRWDDPEIGIRWPIERPSLSTKDSRAASLSDLHQRLPTLE